MIKCISLCGTLLLSLISASIFSVQAALKQDVLAIGLLGMDVYHDPAWALSGHEQWLSSALYETLVVIGDDGRSVEPGVAQSWTVSEDGKAYTFKLRDDARWSNGEPVVADDFVEGWFRAMMPDTRAEYASLHLHIKGVRAICDERSAAIERWEAEEDAVKLKTVRDHWLKLRKRYAEQSVIAVDDHTLRVHLEKPVPYLLHVLALPTFSPMHGRIGSNDFKYYRGNPAVIAISYAHFIEPGLAVFNGPYRITSYSEADGLKLAVNQHYRHADRVGIRDVHFKDYPTQDALIQAYLQGDVDWVPRASASKSLDAIRRKNPEQVHETLKAGTYYYEFNTREQVQGKPNPFNDPKLRRAVANLINREVMSKIVAGSKPISTLVPPDTILGYTPAIDEAIEYNPGLAKRVLANAGHDDLSALGPITLLINIEGSHVDVVASLVHELKQLGAEVDLQTPSFVESLERTKEGLFHIRRAGWFGDFQDPVTFLDIYSGSNSMMFAGYDSKEFRGLLLAAEGEQNASKRLSLLRQAEGHLLSNAVLIPVYQYFTGSLYDPERLDIIEHAWGKARLDRVRWRKLPG